MAQCCELAFGFMFLVLAYHGSVLCLETLYPQGSLEKP